MMRAPWIINPLPAVHRANASYSSDEQDELESEDLNFEIFEPESDGNRGESGSTLEESSGMDDGDEDYGMARGQFAAAARGRGRGYAARFHPYTRGASRGTQRNRGAT